jgi:hypothetical protein
MAWHEAQAMRVVSLQIGVAVEPVMFVAAWPATSGVVLNEKLPWQ